MRKTSIYTKLDDKPTELFQPKTNCLLYPYIWTEECAKKYGNTTPQEGCKTSDGLNENYSKAYVGVPLGFQYNVPGTKCDMSGIN